MKQKIMAVIALVGVVVVGRLLPHLPNATPVTAVMRLAAARLGKNWAGVVGIVGMLVSDAIIGWYDWKLLAVVYGSFLFIGYAGWFGHAVSKRWVHIFFTLAAPVFFFFTTNTAVWALSTWYPKTLAGLLACYSAGLPFLAAMIIGDCVYMAAINASAYVPWVARRTIKTIRAQWHRFIGATPVTAYGDLRCCAYHARE